MPPLLGTLAAGLDLVLPRTCAGCDRPGAVICPGCRTELAGLALPDEGLLAPHPVPADWPGCTGVLRYEGVAARLAKEVKDGGRHDLVPPLGRLLAESVRRALTERSPPHGGPVRLVPVPSAPAAVRTRGEAPMLVLTRVAARCLSGGVDVVPALRVVRRTRDQAGLTRRERLANLHGAMHVGRPAAVRGRSCLLVDDVLTSGATLTEGRRALLDAGAERVDLAVLMVTARRHSSGGRSSSLPFLAVSD